MILATLWLRGSRARPILAVLSLALGVAGVCATDVVCRSAMRSFDALFDSIAGRVALEVRKADGGLLADDVREAVAALPGVRLALPVVLGEARADGQRLRVLGVDLTDDATLRTYATGRLRLDRALCAREPDAIVLADADLSGRTVQLRERIALTTPTGMRQVSVCGLADGNEVAGNWAVMQREAAEELFARPGFTTGIDVVLGDGMDVHRAQQSIAAALPTDLTVTLPARRAVDFEAMKRALAATLWAAALIGLGLCSLVAFDCLAALFAARVWQTGVLRAVGVRQHRVWGEMIGAGLLLGAGGVALGIPLGLGLGHVILPLVAASAAVSYDVVAPPTALTVEPWSLVAAALVGLGAALLAAAVPTWRMARVDICQTIGRRGRELPKTTVPYVALAVTVAGVATAIVLQEATQRYAFGLMTTALAIVATALLSRPLVRLLDRASSRILGPTALLAGAAIGQGGRRVETVVATLATGTACVVWLTTLAASLEGSVADALRGSLHADLLVSSTRAASGWVPAPVDEGVVDRLAALPGVGQVAGNRILAWHHEGRAIALNAFDPTYLNDPASRPPLVAQRGSDAWQVAGRGEGVIASANFARNFGRGLGDTLPIDSPSGVLSLPIVGLTNAFISPGGSLELSRELLRRHWNDHEVNRVWVNALPGVDPTTIANAIEDTLAAPDGLRVLTSGDMRAELLARVRRAFAPLGVVRLVILLVALIGLANALATAVVDHIRALGIARAIGLRRRRVEAMMVVEALRAGTHGFLLGFSAGVLLGAVWVHTTLPCLMGWLLEFRLPYAEMATLAVMTAAVAVGASVLPASAAARLRPAAALREE